MGSIGSCVCVGLSCLLVSAGMVLVLMSPGAVWLPSVSSAMFVSLSMGYSASAVEMVLGPGGVRLPSVSSAVVD